MYRHATRLNQIGQQTTIDTPKNRQFYDIRILELGHETKTFKNGLVFLTILQGNQVCIAHLLGMSSCELRHPTAAHNCIFCLMRKELGGSLHPIAMVPVAGLVQLIQLKTQINPTKADLEGLAADLE